jgi:hypothetical protein
MLIRDLEKQISEHSKLKLPLPPWQCMFGQKAKDYYEEEKQRTLGCLETLRNQERIREVSTTLVLQLVISAWSLRNRLQGSTDRELKPLLKQVEDIATDYGFSQLWHEKYFSRFLEKLAALV